MSEANTFGKLNKYDLTTLPESKLAQILKLHDASDFPIDRGIDIPNTPTFLRVKEFNVGLVGVMGTENTYIKDLILRDVNVLFCHGESTETDFFSHDNLSIPQVVARFRKEHDLSVVIACNKKSFKLDNDLIYPVGNLLPVPACFNSKTKNGITLTANLGFTHIKFAPIFNIPEKYLSAQGVEKIIP